MPSARLITALAAASLLAAGIAAVAIMRPTWAFPPPAPPRPSSPAKAAVVDPLAKLPRSLVTLLTHDAPDAPGPFIRLTRVQPEKFCKSFETVGLKGAQFQKHEPPMRGWNCITNLVKPIEGDDATVSSLFVSARGLESDRIDNIRVKLNLIDPGTVAPTKTIARDLLYLICGSLGWDPPQAVLDAVEAQKEGRVFDRGVSFDLRREFGDQPRYNLIIIFPRTLGAGGEDRFVTDVRRQPVARVIPTAARRSPSCPPMSTSISR